MAGCMNSLTQENQQDWVTDWMAVIAGERGAQKPSSDRKEEPQLDFTIIGTRVYGNMEDNVNCIQILKEMYKVIEMINTLFS